MIAKSLQNHTVSIFSEISALANKHNAINLSQGFPNFEGPSHLKDIFAKEILTGWNQYITSAGLIELREAISSFYKDYYKLNYDANDEVTVTQGATEALSNTISGLLNPEDEVIVFEPFYDAYIPMIKQIGAKPVAIRLPFAEKREITRSDIEPFINLKTRAIILNFPHNPTGYVPSNSELELLASIAKSNDLLVISDEVYEHITYDGYTHKSIASFLGMKERTIVISSIGKSFSFTGWKVGWALAPKELSVGIRAAHQLSSFSTIPASQKAAKAALMLPKTYFLELKDMYTKKRNHLISSVEEIGFKVLKPKGSYFFLADYSAFSNKSERAFAIELIEKASVALIPPDTFYMNNSKQKQLRFCFSKTDDVLEDAIDKLHNYLK